MSVIFTRTFPQRRSKHALQRVLLILATIEHPRVPKENKARSCIEPRGRRHKRRSREQQVSEFCADAGGRGINQAAPRMHSSDAYCPSDRPLSSRSGLNEGLEARHAKGPKGRRREQDREGERNARIQNDIRL